MMPTNTLTCMLQGCSKRCGGNITKTQNNLPTSHRQITHKVELLVLCQPTGQALTIFWLTVNKQWTNSFMGYLSFHFSTNLIRANCVQHWNKTFQLRTCSDNGRKSWEDEGLLRWFLKINAVITFSSNFYWLLTKKNAIKC